MVLDAILSLIVIYNREIVFNSLNWLPSNINVDVNLLTKGSYFLIYDENRTIHKNSVMMFNATFKIF